MYCPNDGIRMRDVTDKSEVYECPECLQAYVYISDGIPGPYLAIYEDVEKAANALPHLFQLPPEE